MARAANPPPTTKPVAATKAMAVVNALDAKAIVLAKQDIEDGRGGAMCSSRCKWKMIWVSNDHTCKSGVLARALLYGDKRPREIFYSPYLTRLSQGP